VPEPEETFVRLTQLLTRRYPEHPRYGQAGLAVVPHLTVAHGDDELLAQIEADVRPAFRSRRPRTRSF
jgi:hypothetical protein